MKLFLSTLITGLCVSLPAIQAAARTDCLDANRFNLESVCRTTCEEEHAAAFSVSYDDTNDSCRCHGKINGEDTYTGTGYENEKDLTETGMSCYSIKDGKFRFCLRPTFWVDANVNSFSVSPFVLSRQK